MTRKGLIEAISKKRAVELAHGVRVVSRGPNANYNLSKMTELINKVHAANKKKKNSQREDVIERIIAENPWTKAGMPENKGVSVAPKPTGAKARFKTEFNKLGRKGVQRFKQRKNS